MWHKRLLDNKLTYVVIGAFLTCVFTYVFNSQLIKKEYNYKAKSTKEEFVFELAQMLQKRIYNGEVFFWNVRDDARKDTILSSWNRYKEATLEWNEKLPSYYFKLDMYLPKSRHTVKDNSAYLQSQLSFRDYLKNDIQLEMIPIHGRLVELKKVVLKDERPLQGSLESLEKDIENLHIRSVSYSEALCNAISK